MKNIEQEQAGEAAHMPPYEIATLGDGATAITRLNCNSEAKVIAVTYEADHEFTKLVEELNRLHEARAEAVRACNSHAALVAALEKAVHLLAKVEACEMAEHCGAEVGDYLAAAEEGSAALAAAKQP